MKKIKLRLWYVYWVSQYNKEYSVGSLENLLKKIDINELLSRELELSIVDMIRMRHPSIHELSIMMKNMIYDYNDFNHRFKPTKYNGFFTLINTLDYYTKGEGRYHDPKPIIKMIYHDSFKIIESINTEENELTKTNKEKYASFVLGDVFRIIHPLFLDYISK